MEEPVITEEEIDLLYKAVDRIETYSDSIFFKIYENLFLKNPTYRVIFKDVQIAKQVAMFRALISIMPCSLSDDRKRFIGQLNDLGRLHEAVGVEENHHRILMDVLVNTLRELTNADEAELRIWRHFLNFVVYHMVNR